MAGRAVLITGASTGIGCEAALLLARNGFHVYAGVRRAADGSRLQEVSGGQIVPLMLDVSKSDQIHEAKVRIVSELGTDGLWGLVNNAAVGIGGSLEFLSLDEIRRAMEVNFIGPIAMVQTFLPLLRQCKGRLVNIGSMGGYLSPPFNCPYTAPKYAMEAWTDSLRAEVAPQGIKVALIQPGAIVTPAWEKLRLEASRTLELLSQEARGLYGEAMDRVANRALIRGARGAPAALVARAIAHALTATNPKTRYRVGNDAKVAPFLRLLPDSWRDRLFAMI